MLRSLSTGVAVFSVSLCLCSVVSADAPQAGKYFAIMVVDEQTGRGVPLVELKTTNNACYCTDSAGVVAFYEPGLMDQDVFFSVKSHGYEYPKDGFGCAGKALHVTEGGSAELKIKRVNIAERLYRNTGGGIYRDSVLLGQPVPLKQPVLNGLVFGQDSVLNALYQGKMFWIWGDTTRVAYPLGNFSASGATSRLPADGGLDPDVGVDLAYFVGKDGFSRGMAPVPGEGPTWLDALVTLPGPSGGEQMLAAYAKIRPGLSMECYERGFVVFNDEKLEFEKLKTFDVNAPVYPGGHLLRVRVGDADYFYFSRAVPLTRALADREHFTDVTACEAFTCLKEGTRPDAGQIDRDPNGAVRYSWKKNTPALGPKEQNDLIKAGQLKPEEALLQFQDAATGKAVLIHGGSTYWNPYRQRWVMIATELFGTSMLGELWYAEADTPTGPWVYARKIITHEQYSFYNPKQHPDFSKQDGQIVYFEGTYTTLFSGNPTPTPYYDYNQIMYKLDLADLRLVLPVPVYRSMRADGTAQFATRRDLPADSTSAEIAFFACDRPATGLLAIYEVPAPEGAPRLGTGETAMPEAMEKLRPVFYALPADHDPNLPTAVALYEFASAEGQRWDYSTDANRSLSGFTRSKRPAYFVWKNPLSLAIRVELPGAAVAR
jgi:hypothetical protein